MYTTQAKLILDAAARCGLLYKKRDKFKMVTTKGVGWVPEKEALRQFRANEEAQNLVISKLKERNAMPNLPDIGAIYDRHAKRNRDFSTVVELLPDKTDFQHKLGKEESDVFLFKCRTLYNVREKMNGRTSYDLEHCTLIINNGELHIVI
ncbi:MAG: hypothetical protein K5744_02045 [Eubacterium sp.]|nr:hypothetical protein [Eubacterium sp.]